MPVKSFSVSTEDVVQSNKMAIYLKTILNAPIPKRRLCDYVLNAIGQNALAGVEVGETFTVYAQSSTSSTPMRFERCENSIGSESSSFQRICIESLDVPGATFYFTHIQSSAGVQVEGSDENVGSLLSRVKSAFHIDKVEARINEARKEYNDAKKSAKDMWNLEFMSPKDDNSNI